MCFLYLIDDLRDANHVFSSFPRSFVSDVGPFIKLNDYLKLQLRTL
jgi:hypothetical protein